ncbi:CcmD family protein [Salipaludibacillus agaradhaerens]|jgi:CcmD family protein|uniref:CcmD family protein n=1 Tax=Salipaludibacillus agaradhaerens TaxID=76935 RepID=A0A9Q4B503_SALAG|nr:CcmD family protein [Salipaludibacillus agaradhaerens]UJW55961.1 CcmD family protein [Bacillus sp. A116_S68]MCR6098444.1 CcmD family protein [Salipaludibacillus agaradhaerens]MCR6104718.1 CcmD family protein [Salipaludibacillus agaradhaerens]MCR6115926.1 CcmD family protein [Salipaludibacillus agaradhaerens]MCR6116767.1 CcmD family protein [Salipaludibacillus agaradhaerens]
MTYLFAAYAITWLLMASYMWVIGKRQQKAMKEISFLRELNDE